MPACDIEERKFPCAAVETSIRGLLLLALSWIPWNRSTKEEPERARKGLVFHGPEKHHCEEEEEEEVKSHGTWASPGSRKTLGKGRQWDLYKTSPSALPGQSVGVPPFFSDRRKGSSEGKRLETTAITHETDGKRHGASISECGDTLATANSQT